MHCDRDTIREQVCSDFAVSMHDDLVVVGLPTWLDRSATTTLLAVVGAATECSLTVLVDLDHDPNDATSRATCTADSAIAARWAGPWVVGEGCVGLRTASAYWTFDLNRRRLFRSEAPIDTRFVEPHRGVSIRKVWATHSGTTVLTSDDDYLSAAAGWTLPLHVARAAPITATRNDGPDPLRPRRRVAA